MKLKSCREKYEEANIQKELELAKGDKWNEKAFINLLLDRKYKKESMVGSLV